MSYDMRLERMRDGELGIQGNLHSVLLFSLRVKMIAPPRLFPANLILVSE